MAEISQLLFVIEFSLDPIYAEGVPTCYFRVKTAAELGTPLATFGKARLESSPSIIAMPHLSKTEKHT